MLNYKILKNDIHRPGFFVDNFFMLWELSWCSTAYIKEVVEELDKIKNKELDKYSFWYDITTIYCFSWNKNAIIDYEDKNSETWKWEEMQTEVPFEEIYNLMNDWFLYIDDWEKGVKTIEKEPKF